MATNDQFSRPSTNSKASLIARQARILFSAYRRDDFADPEAFVLQLGVVLEAYADEVINTVTHPRTGLQRRCKFPPSIAEVVEACDSEAERIAKLKRYQDMGKPALQPRPTQHRANVFVPATNSKYQALFDRSRTADQRDYRFEDGRAGIWVPLGWLDETKMASAPGFKRMTADDLRAMYPVTP